MAAGLLLSSCKSDNMSNPLLEKSTLRYGAPAFDEIRTEHYMPAFNAAIAKGKAEIDSIVNNPDDPTFENTILALEYAGSDLSRVSGIFFNVNEANTNEQMQAIAEEISPVMTEYSMSILLNDKLFERVKQVYGQLDSLDLGPEQKRLVDELITQFK